MPIGPQLPPHLAGRSRSSSPANAAGDPSDDEGDFGPALPPALAAQRAARGPQRPEVDAEPWRAGPSRVTATSAYTSPSPPKLSRRTDDDGGDDDVIGPVPVPDAGGPQRSAADEFREREERWARERAEGKNEKVVKRDDWMLLPPTAGSLASLDPLKRPTQFNRTTQAPVAVDSSWTETPADRAARLADERAGVKRSAPQVPEGESEGERKRRREREREIREGVERHTKTQRGESLLDQHSKRKKDDADEPPVIWDHDKMMGVTGRMLTDQERARKIKDARGLNDRFGHGKAGAYSM